MAVLGPREFGLGRGAALGRRRQGTFQRMVDAHDFKIIWECHSRNLLEGRLETQLYL